VTRGDRDLEAATWTRRGPDPAEEGEDGVKPMGCHSGAAAMAEDETRYG